MFLKTVFTPGLAHLSYVIGDAAAGVAAVIDPRRDVGAYLDIARANGVRLTHALETHVHADFVSGARELAERTGAVVCASSHDAEYGFAHRGIRDGLVVELGDVRLRTIHTPGHTPEHVCFVVSGGSGADEPWGVFTGDTLFAGEVGRPDLLGEEAAVRLGRQLFESLHERLLPLGDGVEVLPAHGKGSPCGASIGDRKTTTLGYERLHNPRLRHGDRDEFVRELLESAPEVPTYYPRMKRINAEGPPLLPARSPVPPLTADELQARMDAPDALVLDTREIEAWGGAHIDGSVNIALREAFPIWAGWLLRPDQQILLVADRPEDVAMVGRQLLRIGIDGLAGYLAGGFRSWSQAGKPFRGAAQVSVHALRAATGGGAGSNLQVIDARSQREWEEGHVPGARHAFVPHVVEAAEELDREKPVAVYCGSGYRASMAVALLERAGFADVRNVPGSMSAWKAAGYPLENP